MRAVYRDFAEVRAAARDLTALVLRGGGPAGWRALLDSSGVMADPGRRRATYSDLQGVPEHLVAEIVDGELVASPRPAPRHARAASSLGGELYGPFDRGRGGPGGWIILDEPELRLAGDALVPDLAGWRRERMPLLPEVTAFELAPDWVCEVLSPSTAPLDRTRKLPIYARERVHHVWLVDPSPMTLEVLRFDGDGYRIVGAWHGDAIVHAEPFGAHALNLADLWSA